MNPQKQKRRTRIQRHKRVRAKIFGTAVRPRLSVFRSNRFIYAALIDDEHGVTVAASRDKAVQEKAVLVGQAIAKQARAKKITRAVFDRGGYAYHGRVKGVAEGAQREGLIL